MLPHIKTKIPGPQSIRLSRELQKYECPQITYIDKDFPIFWEKGFGANIKDVDGNIYIDLTAAFGVANCGHSNPNIVKAAKRQLEKLHHGMGDVHPTELKVRLAKKLAEITPGSLQEVIFSSTGSEAVESAIKTAMIVTGKPGIIAFEGGFHGMTYGTLSITSRKDFRNPFLKQISPYTTHLPYPNPYRKEESISDKELLNQLWEKIYQTVKKKAKSKYPIGAIITEPILGRGGCVIPPKGFLKGLEKICKELHILLIVDEVYTGFGRTGKWFAINHENVVPDLLCLGKGMANGFPISACIGKKEIMDTWGKPKGESIHTSTFLGNPLGCAMELVTIDEIEKKNLCEQSNRYGEYFFNKLQELIEQFWFIGDIRGKGLLIGIEIVKDKITKRPDGQLSVKIMKQLLKKGIILLSSGEQENVLSLTPPLTITKEQIDVSIKILESGFQELNK